MFPRNPKWRVSTWVSESHGFWQSRSRCWIPNILTPHGMADATIWANTPSMAPPPGVTPNFINPYSREKWVITCAVVCLFSSTLFVGARMFTKSIIIKSLDWADCKFLHPWWDLPRLNLDRHLLHCVGEKHFDVLPLSRRSANDIFWQKRFTGRRVWLWFAHWH